MSDNNRFGSLKDDTNPFKVQSRRNRGRGCQRVTGDESRNREARIQEPEQLTPNTTMAQTFGTYIEKQLGIASQQTNSAYVPPNRNRQSHTPINSREVENTFKSKSHVTKTLTDINDVLSFPELKQSYKDIDDTFVSTAGTTGTTSGWQSNGVEIMSQANKNNLVEEESDDIRPGWIRLTNGKISYGPPSSNYERVVYNNQQARNAVLNELRRRHEENKQYDYEMNGDRMYEDRMGSFSDNEEDDDDSNLEDNISSSYDSDSQSNDGNSDDWY